MARHVDKMAFIHSCWTDSNNHSPALLKINTGMTRMGFPCVGSLGHLRPGQREPEPARLRGHVRHARPRPAQGLRPELGRRLPAEHLPGHRPQAARARRSTTSYRAGRHDRPASSATSSTCCAGSTAGTCEQQPRRHASWPPASRPSSWPTACRWPPPRRSTSTARPRPIAAALRHRQPALQPLRQQCLMARRLVERGVRFVQIYSGGEENERSWDGHTNIAANHTRLRRRDRPAHRRACSPT